MRVEGIGRNMDHIPTDSILLELEDLGKTPEEIAAACAWVRTKKVYVPQTHMFTFLQSPALLGLRMAIGIVNTATCRATFVPVSKDFMVDYECYSTKLEPLKIINNK